MIHHSLLLIISLFFAMAILYLLSNRLKISSPILLVIGGLGISFIPGIPEISISPDLIFLIFLPPLLFEAAWQTSWNSFWKWKRPIALMGFGLVFLTSFAVALFSVSIIPGFTLALGCLLGGIISPPDAVAATSVLKGFKMPRRGMSILEGESLVNDAASLTVFRFALAAILTGQFVLQEAAVNFLVLAVMGVFVGLVIAHILYFVLKYWAQSSSITTPITLIAPYLMYIVAEELKWSGVLAVVSGGLFLSFRSKDYLNYHTRIQTKEVWETVGFLMNGFVFILIGLELPVIVEGLEGYSIRECIYYALLISIMIIVLRILLVYAVEFIPRLLSKRIRLKERHPGFRLPFILGWAGMRGVVSLASALAIPLYLSDGVTSFPHRNLILFITFVVILITLVFQGLTLPLFMKWLKVKEEDDYVLPEKQLLDIRYRLSKYVINYMDEKYAEEMAQHISIARIKDQYQGSIKSIEQILDAGENEEEARSVKELYKIIMLDLVDMRRASLHKIEEERTYDDDVIKDLENSLDLEEARLKKL